MESKRKVQREDVVPLADGGGDRFRRLARRLPELLNALRSAPAIQRGSGVTLPQAPGIYLLTEDGVPVYVGQTRNLRRRLAQHGAAAGRENQATFAFDRARREAEASTEIDLARSRRELAVDRRFEALFRQHRERVARMTIRVVEVDDPELRTVFEVYATVLLGTENSFETH
jgi:predicted GIY-YIG superfamily endonuclease